MAPLWSEVAVQPSTTCLQHWLTVEGLYNTAVAAKYAKKKGAKTKDGKSFPVIDRWYRQQLPTLGARRTAKPPKLLTRKQVMQVVDWKLMHGHFRPTLKAWVGSNKEPILLSALGRALKALGCWSDPRVQEPTRAMVEEAVQSLTTLRGFGPATSSALLAVYSDNVCFMSDEALACVFGRSFKPKYTLKEYGSFWESLTAKSKELDDLQAKETDGKTEVKKAWTASRVEMTLWTWSILHQLDRDALPSELR